MNDNDVLEQQAIDAAMQLQWPAAVKLNAEIIKNDKHNLAAYLRLGFANLQLRKIKEAKKYYTKALKIQPKNMVALENLEKIEILGHRGVNRTALENPMFITDLFIDIPGKTKSISLVNSGQKNVLAKLVAGQELNLKIKKRKVEARTSLNEYVGTLPDDISRRLIHFLRAKSIYTTIVKEASLNRVVVFIKEQKKGRGVQNHSSFPHSTQKAYMMYSNDEEKAADNEEEITGDDDVGGWEKIAQEVNTEEKDLDLEIPREENDETEEE